MVRLLELTEKEKKEGYSEANASAKVCQDLVLKAISNSQFSKNVTIKGGVVMRSKTKNIRRATQDLDIDFIKYSLSDSSIDLFVEKLNNIEGIRFQRIGNIEELNQQDYRGKRVFIKISDSSKYELITKLDLGVHKNFDIEQEEYCFDISFSDEGASLLINSNEQMFCEKLSSLLKFGSTSTRYKDVFDMYYLIDFINRNKLERYLNKYIYQNDRMKENSMDDIIKRIDSTFNTKMYQRRIRTSDKKWINKDINKIFTKIEIFLESFIYS